MNFEIPEPLMPKYEEHREAALSWLSVAGPTLMDRWPKEIMELSIPTRLVEIDPELTFQSICELHDGKGFSRHLKGIAMGLDHMIGWDRKFIRLNSRSPKDAVFPLEIAATISGKEAIRMLSESMRVMDDLMEFKYLPEQPAYIALRDYDPLINGKNEFRCFVKNGDLIAVTAYDYVNGAEEWISIYQRKIRDIIDDYFKTKLKPVLHIEDVVFDLAWMHDTSLILIELNPYGLSDPCFFGSYKNVEAASSYVQCVRVE